MPLAMSALQVPVAQLLAPISTVPPPEAPASVTLTELVMKSALTDWAELIDTVQVPVPLQPAPLQPLNTPVVAVADRTTLSPELYWWVHVLPQSMLPSGVPAVRLCTVPAPVPPIVLVLFTVNWYSGENVAVKETGAI